MTNTTTPTTPTTPTSSKMPSHLAYQVKDREGKKAIWTRIGSAWAHADGKGFNIQLDALPTDGRISLRVATEQVPTALTAA